MKLEKGQCCVYWIRTKHHIDVMLEGYVGVSKNPIKRWKLHIWKASKKEIENPIFFNAIQKYGWDNLIKEILIIGDEKYCYEIETKIRPNLSIGWNCNIGGIKPPSSKPRGNSYISPLKGKKRETPWMIGSKHMIGKKASDETKAKMSATRKGGHQTVEQIQKRVISRKATLQSQGRTF